MTIRLEQPVVDENAKAQWEENSRQERIAAVGVPADFAGKTWDEIEPSTAAQREAFAAARILHHGGDWLLLAGDPAFDRQLACIAAEELASNGGSARYVRVGEIVRSQRDQRLWQDLMSARMLVIDLAELLAPAGDPAQARILYAVCEAAMEAFLKTTAESRKPAILLIGEHGGDLRRHLGKVIFDVLNWKAAEHLSSVQWACIPPAGNNP